MRGLGETTAMLARQRREMAGMGWRSGPGPTSMDWTAMFGDNPGALEMASYRPDGLPAGAPLVVVLHGCLQSADGYASSAGWLALADRHGFAVLAPQQTHANNPNRCFNWFSPSDTRRGHGEAASIASMVQYMLGRDELDPSRVFVTGLSAGGAMSAVMLATYPDRFAGGAIIAGLPYGVAQSVPDAMRVMRAAERPPAAELARLVRRAAPGQGSSPRVSVWHGGADAVVDPANAEDLAQQWAAVHGLGSEPDETFMRDGRTQRIWRSPETGETLVESHRLDGFGHGTPLAAKGPAGVGATGPFMLEAGVSSSSEILEFWGLAQSSIETGERPSPGGLKLEARSTPRLDPISAPKVRLGERVMSALPQDVPASVQEVIAKALRSAGLM